MESEKRKRSRVGVMVPLVIVHNNLRLTSVTKDISLKGLLAVSRPELNVGAPCSLSLRLTSGININIDAIVAANNERGTAFDFVKMDESSFYHLHNIVRLHSDNPDKVDDELLNPAFDIEMLERFNEKKK